jgi:hypothetical protein
MAITVHCVICDKAIQRKPHEFIESKVGCFCSRTCLGTAMKTRVLKTGAPQKQDILPDSSRARARAIYEKRQCEQCDFFPAQIHHKDGNPYNNDRFNIAFLCPKHHVHADRMDLLKRISFMGGRVRAEKGKRDSRGKFAA